MLIVLDISAWLSTLSDKAAVVAAAGDVSRRQLSSHSRTFSNQQVSRVCSGFS